MPPEFQPKALVSSIPSDSHMWNLIFMQLLLEEKGFAVVNLGACVPIEILIKEAHKHKPDLLVISTVNGHGHFEGLQIMTEIKKYQLLKKMQIVIGGKLGILGKENQAFEKKLLDSGFHGVFHGENSLEEFSKFLRSNKFSPKMNFL
jgi:methylaspartate mutase sigma subunit